jgi:hypothetical protein
MAKVVTPAVDRIEKVRHFSQVARGNPATMNGQEKKGNRGVRLLINGDVLMIAFEKR